jgi:tRNA threonylcarbamoyladenosine biosynthesis protein TsaB
MALILNMETASERCSVVIAKDGVLLGQLESQEAFDHTAQLNLLIENCLDHCNLSFADLEAIAISIGPGSFTSLRAGLSTAKGLCYALDLPLLAIDTLQIIAEGMRRSVSNLVPGSLLIPMMDARSAGVYMAIYNSLGNLVETPKSLIFVPGNFIPQYWDTGTALFFGGSGATKLETHIQAPFAHILNVSNSAVHMYRLAERMMRTGEFSDLAYIEPFYLKPPNITKPKQKVF